MRVRDPGSGDVRPVSPAVEGEGCSAGDGGQCCGGAGHGVGGRAVISAGKPRGSSATIDRAVSARLERQTVLARENPPMLDIVVETITPAEPGIGYPLIPASWHLAHRD